MDKELLACLLSNQEINIIKMLRSCRNDMENKTELCICIDNEKAYSITYRKQS